MRGPVLFSLILSTLDAVKNCDAQRKSAPLPFWVNEAVFGPLQNAFENVNRGGNGVYVLLWATYNNDPAALGNQFKCVITYNTKRNALDHTLRSHFKFRNSQSGTTYRKTRILVKAVKSLGYRSIRNALQLEQSKRTRSRVQLSILQAFSILLETVYRNNGYRWIFWNGAVVGRSKISKMLAAKSNGDEWLEHENVIPQKLVPKYIDTLRNCLGRERSDGKTFTNVLIFSNGRNCDVFFVPKHGNGCELWVREDWVKKLPLCCVFIYRMCALGKPTYTIYTAEECAKKQNAATGVQRE